MVTKTYTLSGLHCSSCSMLIEGDLEDLGAQAAVNYHSQTMQVTFDEQKVSERTITEAVKKLGYGISGSR